MKGLLKKKKKKKKRSKISSRIFGWKSKLLSQAGRTTLIKTVANTIPTYTIYVPISFSKILLP
jgi:hypothetical protein